MLNLFLLLIAITLEVCGDASIRIGLRASKPLWFFTGAILVICYGTMISLPSWTFGRTMGVYIAMFFIISQLVARTVFKQHLTAPIALGGTLIIFGGIVILLWRPS